MKRNPLQSIADWRSPAGRSGLPSVCSAHPMVLEAAMRATMPTAMPLLIEATCNQVNQEGGYTGMTPVDFRIFVERIAQKVEFPVDRIILGGDHLGPNPWKNLRAGEAMKKAQEMIRAYSAAGFTKLHLDCSMGCDGEPMALNDEETAARAACLAAAAEAVLPGGRVPKPVYVIGTEVPVPGGATEALDTLDLTDPENACQTVKVHEAAFAAAGQANAFTRVIAAVVQPGVEFGNHNVLDYDSQKAQPLSAVLDELPGFVFEAHSTDYQTRANLTDLVKDGFAILKVGPGLTFVFREALYGLDYIAEELFPGHREETLRATMERVMLETPGNWEKYYNGTDAEREMQRHFSYSDRIRYYWPRPDAVAAVGALFRLLGDIHLPETLVSQYLGACYPEVRTGQVTSKAYDLVLAAIQGLVNDYIGACGR